MQAAIPFYGIYDLRRYDGALHPSLMSLMEEMIVKESLSKSPESFAAASPITHVSADAPPFFVLHGRNDSLALVEQARELVARLREVSRQPVVYAELPLAHHGFDILGSTRAAHAAVAVEQFLAEIYASRTTWA